MVQWPVPEPLRDHHQMMAGYCSVPSQYRGQHVPQVVYPP